MGNTIQKCALFPAPSVADEGPCALPNVLWDEQAKGTPGGGISRPFLWLEAPGAEVTLLHFHANAEDLRGITGWLSELSHCLCANILAIEYPGYGLLQVPHVIEDLESVGDVIRAIDSAAVHALMYLVCSRCIPSQKIILHGRSIGCGPALRLARYARDWLQLDLGGIVLQSPSLSIQQVAADWAGHAGQLLMPAYYDNMAVLRTLCGPLRGARGVRRWIPTLLIHGEQDDVIGPYHAHSLHCEAVKMGHPAVELWLAANATHQEWDIIKDVVHPIASFVSRYVLGSGDFPVLAGLAYHCEESLPSMSFLGESDGSEPSLDGGSWNEEQFRRRTADGVEDVPRAGLDDCWKLPAPGQRHVSFCRN